MDKFFKEKLELVIYTVGYAKEGEAIVAIVKMDDVVSYTIAIDGYKVENRNIAFSILEYEKIENIDLLCWSHPDTDHSLGLEDYKKFISNRTKIVVGDGYSQTIQKWDDANPVMNKFIRDELMKDLKRKDRVIIKPVSTGMNLVNENYMNVKTAENFSLKIDAFAPNNYLNLRREIIGDDLIKNNISVGLTIHLGEAVAIFCADVPNVVFNQLNEFEFPTFVEYIKIPHHGSKSSNALLKKIQGQPLVACTTVNAKNSLPNKDILNAYKKMVKKIYCTNDLTKEEQLMEWGVHQTVIRIDAGELEEKSALYGHAKEVV